MNFDYNQANQVAQFWLDLMSRMGSMAASVRPGAAPPEATRQMRSAWMSAMAEQVEQFMRSEQFLTGMKQAMDSSLDMHKQYQALLTTLRHQFQGVATQDVDAIMVMLRHMETRVLEKLDGLEARLERLAGRLDEIDADPQPKIRLAGAQGQE
jgi:extradiol dioxygenase family protein